jgi:hypothetical protein
MIRRRLHDYDDGFDEATLWLDEDLDLYGESEHELPPDAYEALDFDALQNRRRQRSDARRRERRLARRRSWDDSH